jgi:hypothetical protein
VVTIIVGVINMNEPSRRDLLKLVGTVGIAGLSGTTVGTDASRDSESTVFDRPSVKDRSQPRAYENYTVRRVPDQYETIQMAVDAAQPRDLVLVKPGVYREEVTVIDTPRLTIRGTNRNEVILDGEFARGNAIVATEDGVTMENMTARNYTYNGFYWTGVNGYRGSYLTAYNNGDYGIYAFNSVNGRFDHSYASGHPDSGFYIGQCNPCHALIENVEAENNALGYSGTNAGGDLLIRDSTWHHNMSGIVPNTLDSEKLAPQSAARIENNTVYANNNETAPTKSIGYPTFGTGINVAGGTDNEIVNNAVRSHSNFGIVLQPYLDSNLWLPERNLVRANSVEDSGRADLALGAPAGVDNRFEDNEFSTSRPSNIEDSGILAGLKRSIGDPWVTLVGAKAYLQTELGSYPGGDWRKQPIPPEQPSMPNPNQPPREPVGSWEGEN